MRNYNIVFDEELNDENDYSGIKQFFSQKILYSIFSESDKKPVQYDICTPNIAKIRMFCANMIWREWSNEKHWGPRVGVILVLIIEPKEEKVYFIYEIIKI